MHVLLQILEDPRKTSRHKMSVIPNKENKNNPLESLPNKPHVHKYTSIKVACTSESHKLPFNEGVFNICGHKRSIRRIGNHEEKGIECHVNYEFERGRVQKNANNAENYVLRLG